MLRNSLYRSARTVLNVFNKIDDPGVGACHLPLAVNEFRRHLKRASRV